MNWYCIEIQRPGKHPEYVGKIQATLEEIRTALPKSYISGNLVTVYGRV